MAVWLADVSIRIMLRTRANERRIRPTERVPWPRGLKRKLMRRQNNTCAYCGHRRISSSMEIDHITPVVRGASNDESNLQVICRPCNMRKGIQTDEEFRTRYARLVPQRRLTPPGRRISQSEFTAETRQTRQTDSVDSSGGPVLYPGARRSAWVVWSLAERSAWFHCSRLRRGAPKDSCS